MDEGEQRSGKPLPERSGALDEGGRSGRSKAIGVAAEAAAGAVAWATGRKASDVGEAIGPPPAPAPLPPAPETEAPASAIPAPDPAQPVAARAAPSAMAAITLPNLPPARTTVSSAARAPDRSRPLRTGPPPTTLAAVTLPALRPVRTSVPSAVHPPARRRPPRTEPPPITLAAVNLPALAPVRVSVPKTPQPQSASAPRTLPGLAPVPVQPPTEGRVRTKRSWVGRIFRFAAYAIAGYAALCLVLILAYRFVNPPASTLMVWQRWQGDTIYREWVPLGDISPNLIRAVIASEDAKFCRHNGVDLEEFKKAIKRAKGGVPRGASTISMQVAKNLFLWPSRSYIRKAIEIPLTLVMEVVWPKYRMLEIYLNIAEWGDGVYGAEAASRYHFDKAAAKLSLRQAALLAVALPNPLIRDAGSPGRGTSRLARRIVARVKGGGGPAGCVLTKRN